jgi:hypothetical protein
MAVANSTSITWQEVIVAVHGSNIAMKNSQIQTFTVATWSMNSNNLEHELKQLPLICWTSIILLKQLTISGGD